MMTLPGVADNGHLFVTCAGAFAFKDKRHDLIVEWRRRDGVWDREGLGHTPTLVSSLHELEIATAGEALRVKGRIEPDAWTVFGGPLVLTITPGEGGKATYAGEFNGAAIAGEATMRWEPAARASRGRTAALPAILQAFAKDGPAGRLYDFSYAGRGTQDPTPGLPVFHATAFGVEADSGKEALPGIQAAIDAASRAGGGVVQLPAGILDCNVEKKLPALRIAADRVMLRGAGSGLDGTILVNHRYSDTPDPKQPWRAGEHPLLIIGTHEDVPPERITAVTAGRRGERVIAVEDASALRVGQTVLLRQLEVEDGSLARDLVQGQVAVARNWQGAGKELVSQIAVIVAVDGNHAVLDAPLHRNVTRWPAELCRFAMIAHSGIAALRMRGHWGGYFIHHKNGEHDNGWDQVKMVRVRAGYAGDLVCESTTSAIGVKDCLGCVVENCRIMGNLGHNGFVLGGRSTGNLFLRCHAGRNMHGFNVNGTLAGNAVVECTMDEPSGVDLHGGIGCDNLFDAMVGGVTKGGGSAGAVPPRHGPGFVLWNWCCGHYNPYKVWQRYATAASHKETPGFIAVGLHGAYGQEIGFATPEGVKAGAMDEAWGYVESPGQAVQPRSLFHWMRGGGTTDKRG